METIENTAQLNLRIMHLKSLRFEQEENIKRSVRELAYHANPINMIKDSVGGMFSSDHKMDNGALITAVLSIIDMLVLRRPGSIKKALMSLGLNAFLGNLSKDKIVAIKDRIVDFVTRLRGKREEHSDPAEEYEQQEEYTQPVV